MKTKKMVKKISFGLCTTMIALTMVGGTVTFAARPTGSTTEANNSFIGEGEAQTIAFEHADISEEDTTFVSCHIDYDNGIAEYDVEFISDNKEYDYEIDAQTGGILSYSYEMKIRSNTASQAGNRDYIDEEIAQTTALQHAGITESDIPMVRVEFDIDDGFAEYEVEWNIDRTEYNYTINAVDGEILEVEVCFFGH